ncbi:MAG: sensor histidine kinase [Candidatus Levyibacteriota bacterium]
MVNAVAATADSGLHRLAAATDAVRGIRLAQVRVTVVLGLCLTAITLVVFLIPIAQIARNNSWWAVVTQVAVGDQIRAFILLIALVVANRAADEGYPARNAYVLAALVGCVVGVAASETFEWAWRAVFLTGPAPAARPWLQGDAALYYRPIFDLTNWLLIGSAAVFLYAGRRAALRTAQRLRTAELERIRRSKLALESRLQAMQARVEPQFLFNTLVQVERLYELDSELATRMLEELIAYLRAAMPLMRDTSSTVAQELELARAYLDIIRMRLGERIAVTIQTPPGSEDIRMPPMVLLPLVDHAIVRGLTPASAGGAIGIRADVEGGRLRLTITDSGAGFVPEVDGEGLTSIRERLNALYGDQGTLQLRRSNTTSTEAVLDIPLEHRTLAGTHGCAPD